MEIWVAGATGVLGRRAVPLLLEAGHTVVGLARDKAKWPDAPRDMRFIPCDITVEGHTVRAFNGSRPDAIVHMATALPSDRPTRAALARNDEVRREGTRNLVEAAVRTGAYFVHLSSYQLAAPAGDHWITEDSPIAHSPLMDSAIDAERTVREALSETLVGCILRPCTVYCADSAQFWAMVQAVQTGMPVMIGDGGYYWSFIHPRDVAGAVLKALELRPAGETYYIGDDEPLMVRDCLAMLAARLGVPPPKSIAPFLAKMAVGADMVDLLTGSRRVSSAKAKRDLGWEPVYPSLRYGLAAEYPGV